MQIKGLYFLLLLILFSSCDSFLSKNKNSQSEKDTIIDLSSVDTSPAFEECEEFLDDERTSCFRKNMQSYFTNNLKSKQFSSNKDIDEEVLVTILISDDGSVFFDNIDISDDMLTEFENLEPSIHEVIENMPQLLPAIKRGIPVSTQYTLPIVIKTKD